MNPYEVKTNLIVSCRSSWHFIKCLHLHFEDEWKSYGFKMTWGRVNDDRLLILGELSSLSIHDAEKAWIRRLVGGAEVKQGLDFL